MVQFYRAVFLDANTGKISGWVDPQDYCKDRSLMSHAAGRSFVSAVETLMTGSLLKSGCRLVWAGDYAAREDGADINLYNMCEPATKLCPEESDTSHYGYIVNHTKKQFVSKDRSEKYTDLQPLPLLTREGVGYGPGEYPTEHSLVGYWARDNVRVEKKRPQGYVEIIFDLA